MTHTNSEPELSALERAARIPFLPALKHVDARLALLFDQLNRLEQALGASEQRQAQRLQEACEQIRTDAQGITQTADFVERAVETAAGLLELSGPAGAEQAASLQANVRVPPRARDQEAWTLDLLRHDGALGRAGLWFNPPVVIGYSAATGFELNQVHERIVEVPFVFRCMARVPDGGTVLDVGCTESTVALSLASLGYRTTALDQRPYALSHPNLTVVTRNIADWPGPGAGALDAIICLSTLEHLGLEAYGAAIQDSGMDHRCLDRFRDWLKPGGLLVLTAPYGRPAVTAFERTYGRQQMDALLAGWRVIERQIQARSGRSDWAPRAESDEPWPDDLRGVALIAARPA